MLQKEHLEAVRKAKKGEKVASPKVRQKVCQLFGVSDKTCQTIVSTHLNDNKHIHQTGEWGNVFRKETRIPNTKKVVVEVRDHVQRCRGSRQRVTARQVLDVLHQQGCITVAKNGEEHEKTALCTAHRNVWRFLQKNQCKRGK